MTDKISYSIPLKLFFWLFWLVGAFAVFLFVIFMIAAYNGDVYFPKDWGYIAWDAFIVLTGLLILSKTAWHFFQGNVLGSKLLLWVVFAAIGLPLIGFGGCLLPETLGQP